MLYGLRYAAAIAAVALSAPLASPAQAQGGVQIGTLTCNAAGSMGFIFGSTNQLACAFSAAGRTEHYNGQISKFGVDIGFTQGGVLVWTVFAPTAQIGPAPSPAPIAAPPPVRRSGSGARSTRWLAAATTRLRCSRSASKAIPG